MELMNVGDVESIWHAKHVYTFKTVSVCSEAEIEVSIPADTEEEARKASIGRNLFDGYNQADWCTKDTDHFRGPDMEVQLPCYWCQWYDPDTTEEDPYPKCKGPVVVPKHLG